jgi:hypothetical protein
MQDAEAELIMRTLVNAVQTYDQVAEVRNRCALFDPDFNGFPLTHRLQLLSLTPPYTGGLLPLSFGLFHQQEVVRDLTVDLFTQLRMFPVSLSIIRSVCPVRPLTFDVCVRACRLVCSFFKRSIIFNVTPMFAKPTRASREAAACETPRALAC